MRGRRVALGVLLEQLDLAAARLVVDLLQRQLEPVQHVLAGLGEDPGEGPEVSDADGLRGGGGTVREENQGQSNEHAGGGAQRPHAFSSLSA